MTTKLVIFDMDGVLTRPNSSWQVVHETLGTQNSDAYELYMARRIDDMEFIRADVERWNRARPGITVHNVREILDRVPFQRGFHATMEALERRGIPRAMISGGLMHLALRVAAEGGIHPVYANDVVFDAEGSFTGEGIVNVEVRSKGRYVRPVLEELGLLEGPGEVVAVGDSGVDLDMFGMCDVGIAFNPRDDGVRQASQAVVDSDDLTRILAHLP